MKDLKFKNFIGPVITAIIIFVACTFASGGLFGDEQYRAKTVVDGLSNCFAIPGIFLGGVGLIGWAAKFGTFDMLSYGTKSFLGMFIRSIGDDLPKTFYDYRIAKDDKGRRWRGKGNERCR